VREPACRAEPSAAVAGWWVRTRRNSGVRCLLRDGWLVLRQAPRDVRTCCQQSSQTMECGGNMGSIWARPGAVGAPAKAAAPRLVST
jgi:hypothetical protein